MVAGEKLSSLCRKFRPKPPLEVCSASSGVYWPEFTVQCTSISFLLSIRITNGITDR